MELRSATVALAAGEIWVASHVTHVSLTFVHRLVQPVGSPVGYPVGELVEPTCFVVCFLVTRCGGVEETMADQAAWAQIGTLQGSEGLDLDRTYRKNS